MAISNKNRKWLGVSSAENQPYFDNYARFGAREGLLLAKGRKEILEKFRYSNLWLPGDHCLIFCMFIGKSEEAP